MTDEKQSNLGDIPVPAELRIARAVRDDMAGETGPTDESTAAIVASLVGGIMTLESEVLELKDRVRRLERGHSAIPAQSASAPTAAVDAGDPEAIDVRVASVLAKDDQAPRA